MALSCALLSLAVMPTVTADDTTGSAEVTAGSLTLSTGATHDTGFTIPTVSWSAAAQTKCHKDTDAYTLATDSAAYLSIGDLDATTGHYLNVAVTDFDGASTAGTMAVDAALYLSFEQLADDDCTAATASDAIADVFQKMGDSHASFSIASHVSPSAFDLNASATSWIALGNAAADVVTGSNDAIYPGSYGFKVPSVKMTYPAGQTGDTYTATMTFATSTTSS